MASWPLFAQDSGRTHSHYLPSLLSPSAPQAQVCTNSFSVLVFIHVSMCICHMRVSAQETRRGDQVPLEVELQTGELPHVGAGNWNLCTLEEKLALLTTDTSLSPWKENLILCVWVCTSLYACVMQNFKYFKSFYASGRFSFSVDVLCFCHL